MKISLNKNLARKFQVGGPIEEAPVEQEAPVEEAPVEEAPTLDPMQMLLQVAAQALQNQDCQAAMQVCQALMELAQGAGPAEEVGEPVFKKGGRLVRRIKK